MPWINKASLTLYIARIIVTRGWPARDCSSVTNLKFGRNTVLSSSSLLLKHRNLSLSRLRVDLRRHLHDFWDEHRSMCTHSIDDPLPHASLHYAATGEMVKGSLKIKVLLQCSPLNSNPLKTNFRLIKILSDALHRANK